MKIVFASHNAGKIRELQRCLDEFHIEIIPQAALGVPEVDETASTFIENALLKARNACALTQLPAIADDSGLEVFALQGKPGIHSARYAGPHADSKSNISKLLTDLEKVPDEKRAARFYCTLVYLSHPKDPTPLICQCTWDGSILRNIQGNDGFGYDPVFYIPNEKCTAAELSLDKKNQLSHRGQALRLLIEKLPDKIKTDTK